MEDGEAHVQGIFEGVSAFWDDHEFLDIDGGVGMGAAVDDVDHGDGEYFCIDAADVFVEGEVESGCGGVGGGEGDA